MSDFARDRGRGNRRGQDRERRGDSAGNETSHGRGTTMATGTTPNRDTPPNTGTPPNRNTPSNRGSSQIRGALPNRGTPPNRDTPPNRGTAGSRDASVSRYVPTGSRNPTSRSSSTRRGTTGVEIGASTSDRTNLPLRSPQASSTSQPKYGSTSCLDKLPGGDWENAELDQEEIIYNLPNGLKTDVLSDVTRSEDSALSESQIAFVKKPDLGQVYASRRSYGTRNAAKDQMTMLTNYFHIGISRKTKIYKYNVAMEGLPAPNVSKQNQEDTSQALDTKEGSSSKTQPTAKGSKKKQPVRPAKETSKPQAEKKLQLADENKIASDNSEIPDQIAAESSDRNKQGNVTTATVNKKPMEGLIRKRRRMFEILLDHSFLDDARPAIATDYAGIILTATKLSVENHKLDLRHYNPGDDRDVSHAKTTSTTITYDSEFDLSELQSQLEAPQKTMNDSRKDQMVQALNLILKQTPKSSPKVITSGDGSKYYPMDGERWSISNPVIARKGFFASVRTSTARILLNVNVSTSTFYPEGLASAFIKTFDGDYHKANFLLKRLRVSTDYFGSRKFKIVHGFAHQPGNTNFLNAHEAKFDYEGKATSVADYFSKRYGKTVQRPSLPVLDLGMIVLPAVQSKPGQTALEKGSDPVETVDKNVSTLQSKETTSLRLWVPAEFCNILPGQAYGKKLDADETTNMIKFAQKKPAENATRIVDAAEKLMKLSAHNPCLYNFGINVSPTLIAVPARRIVPPSIEYKSGRADLKSKPGTWNPSGLKFYRPKTLPEWSYLRITEEAFEQAVGEQEPSQSTEKVTKAHILEFRDKLNETGMNVPPPTAKFPSGLVVKVPCTRSALDKGKLDRALEDKLKAATKGGVKLLLVLLPCSDAYLYSSIKRISELIPEIGIRTVCAQVDKFTRVPKPKKTPNSSRSQNPKENLLDPAYIGNLALKVNLKLGGQNYNLKPMIPLALDSTMVIGIDVNHPAQGAIEDAGSIAGVVANTSGEDFSQWPCSLRTQGSRQEIIKEQLKDMIKERLDCWEGKPLTRLLVYRDGVSEGQYKDVLDHELTQIREACTTSKKCQKVKIAVIIVTKRHHTRFYPTKKEDADKDGNPLPGTVVDRGITMETGWDFFLQAHKCLQGTAKPAHYIVLRNEFDKEQNALDGNALEQVTHNLSYAFGRATKAVSICAPAYYAHLACERGKVYLHKEYHHPDVPSSSAVSTETESSATRPSKVTEKWTRTRRRGFQSTEDNSWHEKDSFADSMFYI